MKKKRILNKIILIGLILTSLKNMPILAMENRNKEINNQKDFQNNAHNDVNKFKQLTQKGIEKSSTQFIENSNKLEEIKQLLIKLDELKERLEYKPNAKEILSSVIEPYLTYRENEYLEQKTNLENMAKRYEEIYKFNPNYKFNIEECYNRHIFLIKKESKILEDVARKLQEKIEDTFNYTYKTTTHLIVSYDQKKEKWNETCIESKPIIRHDTKNLVEFIIDSFTKLKN